MRQARKEKFKTFSRVYFQCVFKMTLFFCTVKEGDQTLLYRHPPYPYQEWLACGEEEEKGTEVIGRRKEGKERERKQ